ncbi:MAG: hypothetical protein KFB93_02885 [Simkaniaceae bacterium]|nr:MAG: hypothetical protein KFB93_02885 [Simkaniaceae bacterium]
MDPDKIEGNIQRPYNAPEDKDTPEKVDPEKFKKVMKVEESEETQKRKKRNLPKEEEEGEDEAVQEEAPPPPSSSFSEFMSDKDQLDNVFDKESGGIRRQAAPDEGAAFTAPPSGSISTEGVNLDQESETPQSSPGFSSQPPPSSPQEGGTQQPPPTQSQDPSSSGGYQQPSATPSSQEPSENFPFFQGEYEEATPQQPSQPQPQQPEQPSSSDQAQQSETTPSNQVEQPTEKEKGGEQKKPKKEEDTSLLASQPKTKNLDALKKKAPKGIAPEIKVVPEEQTTEKKGPIPQNVVNKEPQKLQEGLVPPPKEKKEPPYPKMEEGLTGIAETGKGAPKEVPTGEELPQEKPDEQPKEATFGALKEGPEKETAKDASPFKRFTPQEVRNQKMGRESATASEIEGLPVPTSGESEQGGMGHQGKKKDDDSFIEANSDTAGIPLPTFENPIPAIIPATEIPAYSKLSPEVHELFEKMGGVMTIQQDKGITTTTMNINMPGSVFDGTQVILNQYSTAPNSFNIQLVGNPESVKVFNQNLDALKASFTQANFNFETNILNPILTTGKKSPHLIRRGKSAGDKGGRGGKQGS